MYVDEEEVTTPGVSGWSRGTRGNDTDGKHGEMELKKRKPPDG